MLLKSTSNNKKTTRKVEMATVRISLVKRRIMKMRHPFGGLITRRVLKEIMRDWEPLQFPPMLINAYLTYLTATWYDIIFTIRDRKTAEPD